MWLGADLRTDIHQKDTCLKEIGLSPQILLITLGLIINMIRVTYMIMQEERQLSL